uniref:Uncharacterized protein n=1 Tax=Pseudomonas putida (strain ATCC 700007 / DSM 6899 / JCM 31910 / BCRC 17059 / LMG 24140 / F1) TaxID=351746 RepID=A5WB92_PSEP1
MLRPWPRSVKMRCHQQSAGTHCTALGLAARRKLQKVKTNQMIQSARLIGAVGDRWGRRESRSWSRTTHKI